MRWNFLGKKGKKELKEKVVELLPSLCTIDWDFFGGGSVG